MADQETLIAQITQTINDHNIIQKTRNAMMQTFISERRREKAEQAAAKARKMAAKARKREVVQKLAREVGATEESPGNLWTVLLICNSETAMNFFISSTPAGRLELMEGYAKAINGGGFKGGEGPGAGELHPPAPMVPGAALLPGLAGLVPTGAALLPGLAGGLLPGPDDDEEEDSDEDSDEEFEETVLRMFMDDNTTEVMYGFWWLCMEVLGLRLPKPYGVPRTLQGHKVPPGRVPKRRRIQRLSGRSDRHFDRCDGM